MNNPVCVCVYIYIFLLLESIIGSIEHQDSGHVFITDICIVVGGLVYIFVACFSLCVVVSE